MQGSASKVDKKKKKGWKIASHFPATVEGVRERGVGAFSRHPAVSWAFS